MARTTLIVDLDAIKGQIAAVINEGFARMLEHITAAINSYKQGTKNAELDVTGMREQIIANVHVLLPLIGSKHGMSFTMGNRFAIPPDVHVITAGQEPKVEAYVLQGPATCCDKFIDADTGATTGEALKKLLVLTQQMLEFHIDDIGTYGGKGTAAHAKQSNGENTNGWDSNSITNSAANFSFKARKSSHDSDASNDSAIGCSDTFDFANPILSAGFSGATTLYDFADDNSYYTY